MKNLTIILLILLNNKLKRIMYLYFEIQIKDTMIGVLILAALFGIAYITGRTGHRAVLSSIDR